MTTNFDENDVIDLTDSFDLVNNCVVSNVIIELDDSVTDSPVQISKVMKVKKIQEEKIKKTRQETRINFGDCPICWDRLGKNPLASTKCGHVFCMTCLKNCLQRLKSCPQCRCTLKGASAYHPLYLTPQ